MGIFTRFRDIVSANINAILDMAEDPEKMVRLMIQEMEDTLIEIKSNCAGMIAEEKRLGRALETAKTEIESWENKAKLALSKGREDLARAALGEKRHYAQRMEALDQEVARMRELVENCRVEIGELETKMNDARDKQRSIVQRQGAAVRSGDAQSQIRKADTTDAFTRFEAYENGIERLEAEAELTNSLRPAQTLADQFKELEQAEEIEQELERLKKELNPNG